MLYHALPYQLALTHTFTQSSIGTTKPHLRIATNRAVCISTAIRKCDLGMVSYLMAG